MIYDYSVIPNSVRVIDGDSFVCDLDLGFNLRMEKVRIRLMGIDCPERGKDGAKEATEFATNWIGNGEGIVVHTIKKDSFGRWLAYVLNENNDSLGTILIERNHANAFMV